MIYTLLTGLGFVAAMLPIEMFWVVALISLVIAYSGVDILGDSPVPCILFAVIVGVVVLLFLGG